jgi:hypothetical protein
VVQWLARQLEIPAGPFAGYARRPQTLTEVPSRRWWKLGLTPSPLGKDIGSSREVNAFGAERFGERLPAVDLAHVDLA